MEPLESGQWRMVRPSFISAINDILTSFPFFKCLLQYHWGNLDIALIKNLKYQEIAFRFSHITEFLMKTCYLRRRRRKLLRVIIINEKCKMLEFISNRQSFFYFKTVNKMCRILSFNDIIFMFILIFIISFHHSTDNINYRAVAINFKNAWSCIGFFL